MKRYMALPAVLIILALIFTACSAPAQPSSSGTTPQATTTAAKEFTLDDLSKYNGQNGQPAYIAIDGVVYDVSNAKGWKDGIHKGKYQAGKDWSQEILKSPHGKKVLDKLPIMGKLKQ